MTDHHRPYRSSENSPPLSPAGLRQRDVMLNSLIGDMRRWHAARRTRRVLCVNVALVFVIVGAFTLIDQRRRPIDPGANEVARQHAPSVEPSQPIMRPAHIEVIDTTGNVLAKYLVTAQPLKVEALSDDDLLSALERAQRPAGLVRGGGKTWLTRTVTDTDSIAEPSNAL